MQTVCLYGFGPMVWDEVLNPFPKPYDPVLWHPRSAQFYTQIEQRRARSLLHRGWEQSHALIAEYREWKAQYPEIVLVAQTRLCRFLSADKNGSSVQTSNVIPFPRRIVVQPSPTKQENNGYLTLT